MKKPFNFFQIVGYISCFSSFLFLVIIWVRILLEPLITYIADYINYRIYLPQDFSFPDPAFKHFIFISLE